ncbi:MAG: hypothetical protein AAF610_08825 [Pseudomonadota bacterium]
MSRRLLLAAGLVCATLAASGAELLLIPNVLQRLSYDDNLQLRTLRQNTPDEIADQREAYLYRIEPSLEMRARGDAWTLNSTAGIGFDRYDPSEFDIDTQRFSLSGRRFSERQSFLIDGSIRRRAQLTTETTGSGLLEATRVESVSVRPSYQRQLSERMQLTAGLGLFNQHFASLNLQDFENVTADVTLARQLDDSSLIDFTVFAQEFETESRPNLACGGLGVFPVGGTFTLGQSCSEFDTRRESTTYGVQLGWRKVVSERLEFNILAGYRDVESRSVSANIQTDCIFGLNGQQLTPCTGSVPDVEASDTSSGLLAATGLSYRGERYSYSFRVERAVSPVGLGFLIETDSLNGSLRYDFAQRVAGVATFRVLDSESITEGTQFDRRFLSLDLKLDWRLSQSWRVSPGVRWRDQTFDALNQEADSFSVFVNLTYRPEGISL